jgi:putative transposase
LLPIVGNHLWGAFIAGKAPTKSLSSAVGATSVFGTTALVTSVKQCMAVAIEGQIQTWKSNLQRRITRLVMRSSKYAQAPDVRHQLLWLNRLQLWLVPRDQQLALLAAAGGKTKVASLEAHSSRLLRRYVAAYIRRFKPPRFDNLPLQVNQLSAVWTNTSSSKLDGVQHWLRISTLDRGQRIELPIRGNAYAEKVAGELALTFSLFRREDTWFVKVCKKFPVATPRVSGPTLGLDTGMVNLLATSQGAIFGRGFNHRLRRWDDKLQRLTLGLQKACEVRLSQCRRYRAFITRMRGWLTSEVKGAVNRALALSKPATVVIEALTLSAQPSVLSKKMNRLVRCMGAGILKDALTQKAQLQGFKLVEVNPAYTSQECSSCGFISRANRKGERFECVCCGKQAHADAQAARNLVERFREGRTCEYVKHTALGMQGLERWAVRMHGRLDRSTPGTSRHLGVIGDVRAGLREIKGRGSHLGPVKSLESLLSGLSAGQHSTQLNDSSTRLSE